MKVVKVLWIDSCNSNMNWTVAEDIEVEPMYIDSVGVVVKDTDEFLAIAQNYGDNPEQYSNITTIPKGCVKEVFVIHEDDVYENEQKPIDKVESTSVEWSEEDDIMKQHCHQMLALLRPNVSELTKDTIDNCQHWLKSLKSRVQSKLELSEKDERIRENIISYLKSSTAISPKTWITWLEKLGDKITTNEDGTNFNLSQLKRITTPEITDDCEVNSNEDGLITETIKYKNEKQGEPDDKIEPKFKHGDRVRNKKSGLEQTLGSCIEDVYEGAFPFRIKDQDDWELVEQKPANKVEQKPIEWSKEDEYYRNIILYILNNECVGKADKENAINWLKSLRLQYKQEWSNEDEKMKESIIKALYGGGHFAYEHEINWLKSLGPQKQWKPLGKHLVALAMAINDEPLDISVRDDLNELFEQLKQL